MNKQTLKALKGSIKKWELIVAGDGVDNGNENCPLCVRFYSRQCAGCPVMEKTGESDCWDTPYMGEWWDAREKDESMHALFPAVANTKSRIKAARAELRVLKSLLP